MEEVLRNTDPLKPHTGFGIASFVTSICAGLTLVGSLGVAGYVSIKTPGVMEDATSAEAILVGTAMVLGCFLALIGIGLGVAGLLQQGKKKTLSVLGSIFSVGVLLITASLMIIGSNMN